jgi:superoxide dismutase
LVADEEYKGERDEKREVIKKTATKVAGRGWASIFLENLLFELFSFDN